MHDLGYLRLLATDADVADFDEPVRRARGAGLDAERLRELEAARSLALTIRSTLQSRRRRETELTALYDTASDLAALHDVDAVLQSIVRRARALIGADVTYLTLNDPQRGDTYMRVTDGSVSAWFQQLRLPLGSGLGGLVAQRAAPYATANYFTDDRFRHTEDISGAVVEEGLVAILGVPLRRGATVIGVLYAANRSERPFSREEGALLGSLATHAGIAIDNARLMEEAQQALAELHAATQQAVARGEAVERAAAAHERLTDIVASGGGLDEVARAVAEVLGGSVSILDAEGHPLAGSEEPVTDEPMSSPGPDGRAVRCSDGRWVAPVSAGTERLGVLLLRTTHDLDQADRRILERAGIVTALLLLFRRSVAEAQSRVRGDLVADLLSPEQHDPVAVVERARLLGIDLETDHAVVTATGEGIERRRLVLPASQLASRLGGLSGEHAGQIVLILPGMAAEDAAAVVSSELGAAVRAPVTGGAAGARGASAPTGSTGEAFREAQVCLAALRALGKHGTGATAAGLGFLGVLLGGGPERVTAFVDATLGPLLRYDAARRTDLLSTLSAWFAHDRSMAATQRELHVHVNTVRQRLERVAAVLGPGWDEPDRLLQLQLAIQAHRLRGL